MASVKNRMQNGKKNMENKKKKAVKMLILAGMAVCLIPVIREYGQSWQHRAQQEDLREIISEASVQYPAQTNSAPQETIGPVLPEQAGEKPVMLAGYASLYKKNKDLAGWLSIKGMKIDYPVMQSGDDEYYLHHDFFGKDSKYGCLYVKKQADLDAGTNFIIYGHNMKDGSMFGDLDLYLKESFYKEHSTVSFDTLYEKRTYKIVAVFRSQVYNADDDVFKYYQFYEADTQEEFKDFYRNIKKLSLYDTGVKAEFGDTFLTLSTCAYHVKDGRLVVVAKRIR